MGGEQKNNDSTTAEKQRLKEKQMPHNALPSVVPKRPHDLREPVHVCMRSLNAKQIPDAQESQHLIVVARLNCI